jgi:hypothetical protein
VDDGSAPFGFQSKVYYEKREGERGRKREKGKEPGRGTEVTESRKQRALDSAKGRHTVSLIIVPRQVIYIPKFLTLHSPARKQKSREVAT